MEELRGIEEQWRLLGGKLGVAVDDINYPDSTDCLREVVKRELRSIFTTTTWGRIIIALKKAGQPLVADNLKAKYLPGELTTTPSSQYSLQFQHSRYLYRYIVI